MTDITERLARVAAELTAITAELKEKARGRGGWEPGPKARKALDILRAYISQKGGSARWVDCVYELHETHGFGRSASYEHVKRFVDHGLLVPDAKRERLSLPSVDSLL